MIFQANTIYGVYQVTEMAANDNVIIYTDVDTFINDSKSMNRENNETLVISVLNESDIMRIVTETDPALIDEFWTAYSTEDTFQEKYVW